MLGKNNSGRTTAQEGQQKSMLGKNNSRRTTKIHVRQKQLRKDNKDPCWARKNSGQFAFRAHRPRFKSPIQPAFRAHRPRFKSCRQSALRAHRPRFKSGRQPAFRAQQTLIQVPCSKPFPKQHYRDSSVLAIQMTDPSVARERKHPHSLSPQQLSLQIHKGQDLCQRQSP